MGLGLLESSRGALSALGTARRRVDADDARRVVRFLRGRRAFEVRPDDVFISSYPRSGTTWLQQIAHVLLRDGRMDFDHISDVAPWFERDLALGRRTVHDFARLPSPRVFKSHLPRMWLPSGARYLYALRDGRDVSVSYYHFYRSHLGFEGDFDRFFDRFLRGELQYRSWFKHVAGWRARQDDSAVLLVEYERLSADLGGSMRAIARFLGVTPSERRLGELAALCDFEFMKRNEARFDHASGEPGGASRGAFLRRGARGTFADALDAGQLARFEAELQRPRPRPWLELDLPAFLH